MDSAVSGERSRLDSIFRPASIAVVGASDSDKSGGRCMQFLMEYGFAGDLFPVNPRSESIRGIPCVADIEDLPMGVDLAVLFLPADAVPSAISKAGKRGVRSVIVCASGFGETGEEGRVLEARVREAAEETGIALVGPNSLGVLDLNNHLAATFSTVLHLEMEMHPGPIALVSQSGAMGAAILGLAQSEGMNVGMFVSTGNEVGLDFADYVDYLADREDISVILGYIEGVQDGKKLVEAARRARSLGKVIGILKAGRTDEGARAALSHTGALAGSARAYEAAFRRLGIAMVRSPRELLDVALAVDGVKPARGNRVGIVSSSGGAGTIMSDRCSEVGLKVAEFGPATRERLREILPAFVGVNNPVDYGAVYTNNDAIDGCVRAVAEEPDVDIVLFFIGLSPLLFGVLDKRLSAIQQECDKPLIVGWLAGPQGAISALRAMSIPAFEDPIRAVDAVSILSTLSVPVEMAEPRVEQERAKSLRGHMKDAPTHELDECSSRELLVDYKIPFVEMKIATSGDEAVQIVQEFGRNAAVKATGVLHKSDVGAVRLGVGAEDAASAYADVVKRSGSTSALVEPMAAPGVELIAGVVNDPQFGPLVMVGLGGVTAEVLDDTTLELAPLDHELALAMLNRLRGSALFGVFRGRPALDVDAVADVLVELGQIALDSDGSIGELDLNPIVVYEEGRGCIVLDAAVVLQHPEP